MARVLSGAGVAARFPALRHRNFRRYAIGQTISLAGFWMQSVAQGWLVFRLSHSSFALGAVAFVGYLPVLLFSPLAGVVADRLNKHRLIIATQTTAMLLAFVQGAVVATDVATVPIVAALAFCVGVVGAFDLPTRQSFIVDMVGGGEDLASAIAMNASVFNTARVVGPAIAGMLVATVGEAPCFFINGISYVAAIWALLGMRLPAHLAHRTATRGTIRSGLGYVRRHATIAALLGALGVVSTFALQSNVLMPAIAEAAFGRGAKGYGLLLTAYGIGAVLTALRLASRRYEDLEHRSNLLVGLGGMAAGLVVVATSSRYDLALAGQLVAGLGMLRYTATTNTLVQLLVDDAYRGRVMGLHTVMFAGAAPVGALLLGGIARIVGPQHTLLLSGSAALLVAVWLARRLPERAGGFTRAAEAGTQN